MPLIVEDGTGLANAEAYVSLAGFKAYCDNMGLSYAGHADAVLEQKLRVAADYIDTAFRYKGRRLIASQALEFPRADLADWSGHDVPGVPARVVKANCELAFKALSEALYADLDRGGKIRSESVGPISVSYADDAPAGRTFTFAANLLKPYIRQADDIDGGIFFSTSASPAFDVGMFDAPGDGATDAAE